MIELQEEAILVSDIHYSSFRKEHFETLLDKLEKKPPPQLILLGDIFDLLFGGIKYTEKENFEVIQKLENLGKKFEILYFEGNHDFNLKSVFKNIIVIPISKQPFLMRFGEKRVLIAHGDYRTKGFFGLYRRFIERESVLKFLNFLDSNFLQNRIIRGIERKQRPKRKCYKIKGFKDIIEREIFRIDKIDYFIEGHFHQGVQFSIGEMEYFNLHSFACNQNCFIVKSKQKSLLYKNINLEDL
jgi:UDP-2,3-diacylglucosamine hydrolase